MPTILSGILAIYGLVVSVLIASNLQMKTSLFLSFIQLGAGLAVGLAGLAAGFSVGMVLILIFAEVLGLYGLIVALLMITTGNAAEGC
jgi:V-type H+-transporting ATPase proteolipid subunit